MNNRSETSFFFGLPCVAPKFQELYNILFIQVQSGLRGAEDTWGKTGRPRNGAEDTRTQVSAGQACY